MFPNGKGCAIVNIPEKKNAMESLGAGAVRYFLNIFWEKYTLVEINNQTFKYYKVNQLLFFQLVSHLILAESLKFIDKKLNKSFILIIITFSGASVGIM